MRNYLNTIAVFLGLCAVAQVSQPRRSITIDRPEELYGGLFSDVQGRSLFSDSKFFVDCIPVTSPEEIRLRYTRLTDRSDSAIIKFVGANFIPPPETEPFKADSSVISIHIARLWDVLLRSPDRPADGTLIPLNYPYIVPGGRFRELYYWDSYFTMLGLRADGRTEIIENMIRNFSSLIDSLGFIPNGNRTYYLSRSQPPFFVMMLKLLAEIRGEIVLLQYQPQLEREYQFWMAGSDHLTREKNAIGHVVRLPDGKVLNRFWDSDTVPRAESYREDRETAEKAVEFNKKLRPGKVYRDIRSAAESGWDFSSRWLRRTDGKFELSAIHTTDILPVDLNCLLFVMEETLSQAFLLKGDSVRSHSYREKAQQRKKAIIKYFWDPDTGFFMDYDFVAGAHTGVPSLAGIYPLFVKVADSMQAESVARVIRRSFLRPGGLVTTLNDTGEQWDAPNGWAPLQWISIMGLRNYGWTAIAGEIREKWLRTNREVYEQNYKLFEKYNVINRTIKDGGGEYPTQDGFGWTNGVYQALSAE